MERGLAKEGKKEEDRPKSLASSKSDPQLVRTDKSPSPTKNGEIIDSSSSPSLRKKRVQFKDIEILEPIGDGPVGKLYKANWKKYGMLVALRELKHIRPSQFGQNEKGQTAASFDSHIRVLRKISLHPNVVRIFGYVEDKKSDTIYLVTEYVALGNLRSLIEKSTNASQTLEEKQKIKMLIDVSTGICHIHNCRVLHQNLVSHNVMVGLNYNMKVSDFGFDLNILSDDKGNKEIAPEYLEKKVYTKKSDVYAFGLMVLELFSPSTQKPKEPVYIKTVPKEPFPFLPPALRSIVQNCLATSPSLRPTFARIVDLLEDYYYTNWKPEDSEQLPMVVESLHNRLKEKDDEIKKREDKIQHLMERIKALEEHGSVTNTMENSYRPSSEKPLPSPSEVQENISAVFKGKLKIGWLEFQQAVEVFLSADADTVDKMKYLLIDTDGLADKSLWDHLLTWFCPLYPNGTTIEVTPSNKDQPFYLLHDIVDICGQTWFFGWMSPVDTNKLLLGQPTGTFLFRFSSYPGWYTLSVSNEGQVGHWRIKSGKGADWSAFWIDERKYNSLSHIIETHVVEPLKVNTSRSTQRPIRLEFPAERRTKRDETLYSMF